MLVFDYSHRLAKVVGQKENAKAKLVGSLWLTSKSDRDFQLATSLLKFTESLSFVSKYTVFVFISLLFDQTYHLSQCGAY